MYKTAFATLLFLFFTLFVNSQDYSYVKTSTNLYSSDTHEKNQTVYVCTGNYAYAYHSNSNCAGLSNCKGEIRYTEENYAAYNMKRLPCCRCWSNSKSNCKDDAATYGGGGGGGGNDGAAAAIIVGVVIVASAAVLSNDIYAYPTLSIKNGFTSSSDLQLGWAFGLRKTFKKSALEYGVSFIRANSIESSTTGFHFSYVHQILSPKKDKVSFYIGPTLNVLDETGYGGIIGTSYKLLDRLKLDMRYEFTTQTNNLKLGLIFNYQKRYFWQN